MANLTCTAASFSPNLTNKCDQLLYSRQGKSETCILDGGLFILSEMDIILMVLLLDGRELSRDFWEP